MTTTVYKFEIVVPDYENKGQRAIQQALLCDRDTYGWVTHVEEKDVEFFDNRNDKQIKQLFGWQPIDTAPHDGTRVLFFYGARKAVFTAWYEKEFQYAMGSIEVYAYWHLESTNKMDFSLYFEEENPPNCYWQRLMELPV